MTVSGATELDVRDGGGAWSDAVLAAALFAIDPASMGGIVVRAAAGPVRERWMALVLRLLPVGMPFERLPQHISIDRLLGGLDLAATLAGGRRVLEPGVLPRANGGVVVMAMAERWSPLAAAAVASALDRGVIVLERDGLQDTLAARVGVIALDESHDDEPQVSASLMERLPMTIDLSSVDVRESEHTSCEAETISRARVIWADCGAVDDDMLSALCVTSARLGIGSLRAPIAALQVARAHAALEGRATLTEADALVAVRLVLAPRATILPSASESDDAQESPPPAPPPANEQAPEQQSEASETPDETTQISLEEIMVMAAVAAIPAGLLERMNGGRVASRRASDGRAGASGAAALRGRAVGYRRVRERSHGRLSVLATLRAAAPWQRLRMAELAAAGRSPKSAVQLRRDDFRVTRYRHEAGSTIVFAVDASGSSALNRLAEAKGAVELLLSECYARRDKVALVAFRGTTAELLLPPSRSLARAKRSLAGLPGGGGTPLAAGIDEAAGLAYAARAKGDTALIVFMTDGKANVTRSGSGGRMEAQAEAMASAQRLRASGIGTLLVDTSPKPSAFARQLAYDMGGHYLPMPHADARTISASVQRQRQAVQR